MEKDWHQLISQPQYKVKAEKNVFVPVRDGTKIALNIFRPDAKGKFPALLAMSPYGKELQQLYLPPQPLEKSIVWDGVTEAGDTKEIVSRGYVHVVGDIRGSGDSEGQYIGMHSKYEGMDGADIVEWIAKQPWCDGNVGMVGYSYYGEIQLEVAIEQPPHLKAIFPTGVWLDMYRGMAYQGGVMCMFIYGLWDGRGGTSGMGVKRPVSAASVELSPEELERRRQALLKDPDILAFPNLFHLANYPHKNPIFFDLMVNPCDGPFYQERSVYQKLDKIKIPVHTVGTWAHFFGGKAHWNLYNGLNTTKRIMMRPHGFPVRPWRDDLDMVIRWYDHWLKGNDTGMLDEPPIKIWVSGANEWRYEKEWPPKSEATKLYLRPWEQLSMEPELYQDEPDGFFQQPLHVSDKRDSVKYLTIPVYQDIEVIGNAAMYFYASIDQADTNWIIRISDVDKDGSEVSLGTNYLKASHRAVDKSKSNPLQPFHPHDKMEPVVPGEIYEYAVELLPMSHVFKAGHKMKVEIGSMESPRDWEMIMHWHPHLCSSKQTLHKIYRDKAHPSHLLLPVIKK